MIIQERWRTKNFTKIDNLKSQIKKLAHLVAGLLKNQSTAQPTKNPKPLLNPITFRKPVLASPIPKSSNAHSKPPVSPVFFANHKNHR